MAAVHLDGSDTEPGIGYDGIHGVADSVQPPPHVTACENASNGNAQKKHSRQPQHRPAVPKPPVNSGEGQRKRIVALAPAEGAALRSRRTSRTLAASRRLSASVGSLGARTLFHL